MAIQISSPPPTSYWVTHISPLVWNPTFTIILNVLYILESLGSRPVPWFIGLSPSTCNAVWIVTTSWSLIMPADFDSPIVPLSQSFPGTSHLFIFYFSWTAFSPSPKTLLWLFSGFVNLGSCIQKELSPPISLSSAPWGSSHPCDASK